MNHPDKFFALCRSGLMGPTLDNDEVSGTNAILESMAGLPKAWVAYALATAYHETSHTMQPIKEYGGSRYFTRMYDISGNRPKLAKANGNTQVGDGAKYFGRGYVQLTWKSNYIKAGAKLGIDLVGTPDLALEKDHAAHILRYGMREGWFMGKSFQTYLPASGLATCDQFRSARRIINGTDRAADIAGYAMQFQDALVVGGCET
jgi:putative chitinase